MSSVPADPASPSPRPADAAGSEARDHRAPAGVCPLLRSADGAWTSIHPSRDLRCWASEPPIAPALGKQRSLCVSPRHVACATYEAAVAAGSSSEAREGSLLWPAASVVPVALEPAASGRLAISGGRSAGQVGLVALMVVAFAVLLISRTPFANGPTAASLVPVASAATGDSSSLAPSAQTVPSASPVVSPGASAGARTSQPAASPSPSSTPAASPRTYTVHAGDTLAMIAGKYHTTVKALVTANNITDPRTIHPGQVLIIP